jgi:hypothetical protein
MAQPLSFAVSDPETTGTYYKKVTTYLIETHPQGFQVRRRFSDFEWLYKALSNRYFGMLLPALPPKGVMKSVAFIKSRMRGLSLFMDHLRLQPFLRSDSAVLAFISTSDPTEWEMAKKDILENLGEERSPGETKWREVLANYPPPDNAERCIMDVKRQLEPMDKLLARLIESSKRLADKSAAMAIDMSELNAAFVNWRAHEEACGDAARVEYANKSWPQLNQAMTNTNNLVSTWQEVLSFQPDINELVLHENLKFLLAMVNTLRDLINQREMMYARYDRNVKLKEKHEQEQASAAARGKASKVAELDRMIAEDKKNVEVSKEAAELMTKGLFFSELDRFCTEKTAWLRETMGQLAASHFQYAKRLGLMWQGYINDMGFEPQMMMGKARVVFESAARADAMESS